MDLTVNAMWFSIALVFIIAAVSKIAIERIMLDPEYKPRPPVVNSVSLIRLVTFLVGPEVSGHFYQGLESEISHGKTLEFLVPIFGKEVGFGVDITTRTEQMRFYNEALKPSRLRSNVDPMLKEVEDYLAKWGQHGVVDLKHEFEQLIMLIASRCLLGTEVRENMFGEVHTLFRELYNGMGLTSVLFPYAPTPANRRRDKARVKLSEIFTKIFRSRKRVKQVESDVLQNLIDAKYKNGRSTTEAEVVALIIMLLFGGNHTSSLTSTWTGACLLRHQRSLTAAVEEQKQIFRKYGERIDYNILLEMDTLHNCIKEALRMHPVEPMGIRKVHKNFIVKTKEGTEYEIPRGHTIVSPVLYNHNLPYIYKDPYVYDPDRFSPGREEDRVGGKFSYTAFGGGRHTCVGEAYAYMQIKVIWSYLLRNFELKLVSPFPETDWSKLVPEPKGEVMVSYKRVTA
ncbi:hypothetical protein QOZ80_1AG0030040 [Eleusine coracana subsp. coracana]|nr:hypothetical protein QOZ80_1AG0030040 [Eleusine coracana subsp. coracana]